MRATRAERRSARSASVNGEKPFRSFPFISLFFPFYRKNVRHFPLTPILSTATFLRDDLLQPVSTSGGYPRTSRSFSTPAYSTRSYCPSPRWVLLRARPVEVSLRSPAHPGFGEGHTTAQSLRFLRLCAPLCTYVHPRAPKHKIFKMVHKPHKTANRRVAPACRKKFARIIRSGAKPLTSTRSARSMT